MQGEVSPQVREVGQSIFEEVLVETSNLVNELCHDTHPRDEDLMRGAACGALMTVLADQCLRRFIGLDDMTPKAAAKFHADAIDAFRLHFAAAEANLLELLKRDGPEATVKNLLNSRP